MAARWGIDYRWEPRLGGRRHVRAGEPEPDTWWTVAAFRAYAAHTRTPEFDTALAEVLADAGPRTTAVMCSESVWWRCHRRLIADVAVLGRGVPVAHLMPDGRLSPHRPAEGARRLPDGHLLLGRAELSPPDPPRAGPSAGASCQRPSSPRS